MAACDTNLTFGPFVSIKIEKCEVKLLIDTGASVKVINLFTFQELFANMVKLQRSTSVLRSYQTNEKPSRPLDAVIESNTKIIAATFPVIKGNTNTELDRISDSRK